MSNDKFDNDYIFSYPFIVHTWYCFRMFNDINEKARNASLVASFRSSCKYHCAKVFWVIIKLHGRSSWHQSNYIISLTNDIGIQIAMQKCRWYFKKFDRTGFMHLTHPQKIVYITKCNFSPIQYVSCAIPKNVMNQ